MIVDIIAGTSPLYKRDSKGNVRVWRAEVGVTGASCFWRAISGLEDGKQVESGWKVVQQKNVGKANETSLEDQAVAEMMAEFNKKAERGYFRLRTAIDTFDKIKPMLASKHEDAKYDFENELHFSQPKLDGIRCIARRDGLWSRSGKEIVSCPHIMRELISFFQMHPEAILDGELYNHDLRDDFNKITSLVRKTKPTTADTEEARGLVQYHVYDMIEVPEEVIDLYGDSVFFYDRWQWFHDQGYNDSVKVVETRVVHDIETMDNVYGQYLEAGYEGQMIRRNTQYEQNKRSKSLIKRKEFITEEFTVVAVEEGKGNWAGHIKRFILQLPEGTQFGAGVRGTQDTMRNMFEVNQTPMWATLRYFTPTPDGIPRFPVVIDWGFEKQRED